MTQLIPRMTAAKGQPGHPSNRQSLGGALGMVMLVVCPPVSLRIGTIMGASEDTGSLARLGAEAKRQAGGIQGQGPLLAGEAAAARTLIAAETAVNEEGHWHTRTAE